MKILLFLFIVFFAQQANGQIGFSAAYNSLTFNAEEQVSSQSEGFTGPSFTIDYWFRLRNLRIEFKPGLTYMALQSDQADLNMAQAVFSTRIYPFSLDDDCDCPTFSMRSSFFENGFFLSLSPHFGWYKFNSELPDFSGEISEDGLVFHVDLGVGFDIGLSDRFTITPEIRYRYIPDIVGSVDFTQDELLAASGSMSGIYAGLGVTYRWK